MLGQLLYIFFQTLINVLMEKGGLCLGVMVVVEWKGGWKCASMDYGEQSIVCLYGIGVKLELFVMD